MSLQVRNQTSGILERVAGFNDTDSILSPSSQNPISNRAVYAALAQKIDKTVNDLINYYDKSQVYSKPEVRALIGSINTLTIEVVAALPTQDISTTTIYFVGPAAGTNTYDEYVYVNNAWVKIGDTQIDLSDYVTSTALTTALQSYYTKSETDALFNDYYDKDDVDDLLDLKQDELNFDNEPIAGSQNPVTSAGIKTALDNILISGNGGSIIKVHHTAGAAAQGDRVTASKGTYSVSSTFDISGDAIIIGFGEIGEVTITATNGSETGTKVINIPSFSNYSTTVGYGLDYKSWLIAGGMNPSSYSSLDEVLADEEAVRRLMTIHASVDYLATAISESDEMLLTIINNDICAKWINLRDYALNTLSASTIIKNMMDAADKYGYGEWALMPQVPTMTSNIAPYGVAFSSDNFNSNYYAYFAFNGSTSNYWASGDAKTGFKYVGYLLPENVIVKQIKITMGTVRTLGVTKWTIQGSNNTTTGLDGTWTDLHEFEGTDEQTFTDLVVNIDNSTSYKAYRVGANVPGGSNNFYIYIKNLQFYVYTPKGNIPLMTSNTTPYGQAIASSEYSSTYTAFNAFNNDFSGQNAWRSTTSDTQRYIAYKFVRPVCLKALKWLGSLHSGDYFFDVDAYIEYSRNGTEWTAVDTIAMAGANGKKFNFDNINTNIYALYWRIRLSNYNRGADATNRSNCCFQYLQFYGKEMKVSVPKMTSNTAPYGVALGYPAAYSSSYDYYKAYDNDPSTHAAYINGATEGYFGYGFPQPVIIKQVILYNNNGATRPTYIMYSDDGTNWIPCSETVNHVTATYLTLDTNDNVGEHRYWAVHIVNSSNANTGSIDFFGFDYTEYEWDTNYPRYYLYDHGLELETFNIKTGIGSKNPNSMYLANNGATYGFINTKLINVTNYNYAIIKTNYYLNTSNYHPCVGIFSEVLDTYSSSKRLAMTSCVSSTSYFNYINIASISSSVSVGPYAEGTASASSYMNIEEIWLE